MKESKSCLRDMCCLCEEFRATKNEFDNTFVCTCSLNGKGIVIPDVTLTTPDSWSNGIDWRFKDENN